MKKIFLLLALIVLSFSSASPVVAKVLPRFQGKAAPARGGGLVVSPKLRADRKAVLLYLGNLGQATSVVYTLTYETNGKQEGAYGNADSSSGNAVTRELLFGTCSAGVCRYHEGLANMKLEVTAELANGKKLTRRYRIRI